MTAVGSRLSAALDAREARIAKSPYVHLVKREHQPIPHGRALVVWTRCGIQAFEEPWEDVPRCPDCWPTEAPA